MGNRARHVVFSNLIKSIPPWNPNSTKVLVLAHREELLYQAKSQIELHNPELKVEVDQGTSYANMQSDVIIASVMTIGNSSGDRIARYNPYDFKCIIIDEAHHAAASVYTSILKYFDIPKKDSSVLGPVIWGCSATLTRHDGLALNHIFDQIVYKKDFLEMIFEKWLCEIVTTTVKTKIDMSEVKERGSDFEKKSLIKAINIEPRNKLIVDKYIQLAQNDPSGPRRSTVVFAVDINHVKNLENEFRSRGIDARKIVGKTDRYSRLALLENFKKGKFPVLINCEILTEGTDIPNIDCLIMARPTKSGVLFQQMVGRGVRLSSEKKNCLVIDFFDHFSGNVRLVNIPTLMGLNPDEDLDMKHPKFR
ncbi:hypothetical protein BB561_001643 [Smittium simulii]|uniref:Helicase C-terminal domain-containing protein n=1 Tax=Smittium simulii TaxID=133385 RepID=A0A2T9YTV4_9FUNG|nr:hypothetical protein BB561_001643 [Smittium simulii]